jgi:serine/threonine-protein kinase
MMAVLATLLATIAAWTLKPSSPRPVSRLTITLPPGDRLAGLDLPVIALSPDGSRLVYVATRAGAVQQLYLRAMDNLDAKPIPGTEGATSPFFSPDGQWIGFFAGTKLKKISLNGGTAQLLADAVNPRGASWSNRGTIVFGPTAASGLLHVSDGGGASQPLKHVTSQSILQRWPEVLPDGHALLFSNGSPAVVAHVFETGEERILIQGGDSPHYVPSGHLVYAQGGSLMAVPFDSTRLEVKRVGVPVVDSVLQSRATGGAQFTLATTGVLAYVSGGIRAAPVRLVWVTRQGAEQLLAAPARSYPGHSSRQTVSKLLLAATVKCGCTTLSGRRRGHCRLSTATFLCGRWTANGSFPIRTAQEHRSWFGNWPTAAADARS